MQVSITTEKEKKKEGGGGGGMWDLHVDKMSKHFTFIF